MSKQRSVLTSMALIVLDRPRRLGRDVRQSEVGLPPKDVNQFGGRRGRWDFRAAANARRAARRTSRRDLDAGNLPGPGRADAKPRLAHRVRGLAAHGGMERQVSGDRQRRLRGRDQLLRHDPVGQQRLCDVVHRHWPPGQRDRCPLGARPPREGGRLRSPRDSRNRRDGQGPDQCVLRGGAPLLVLQCLLERRPAGADGSAAVSRRLRRDHRGGAGAEHHASAAGVRVESAHRSARPGGTYSRAQDSRDCGRSGGSLRRARRREGRRRRQPDGVPVQGRVVAVFRRGDRLVSHRSAGGGAAEDSTTVRGPRTAGRSTPDSRPAANWVLAAGRCGSRARGPARACRRCSARRARRTSCTRMPPTR